MANNTAANNQRRNLLRWFLGWRGILLIVLVVPFGLLLISQSQAQREWREYQAKLTAGGEHLDWEYYIPPTIPDTDNFYAAPGMKKMFQRNRDGTSPSVLASNDKFSWSLPERSKIDGPKDGEPVINSPNSLSYPLSVVLRWEEEHQDLLKLYDVARKRPKARVLTDYNNPTFDIPNFVAMRQATFAFATMAKAHIVSHEPEKALEDLQRLQRLLDCLDGEPTLVEAMIRTAILGIHTEVVKEGLEKRIWTREQLLSIEAGLQRTGVFAAVVHTFRAETASVIRMAQVRNAADLFSNQPLKFEWDWKVIKQNAEAMTTGLMFAATKEQNLLNYTRMMHEGLQAVDAKLERVYPDRCTDWTAQLTSIGVSPKTLLVWHGIPNWTKAIETAAKNQTLADEARIACALERFRLANGHYPISLQELVPEYMPLLPHDIVSGAALKYRLIGTDSFTIYGVGWNAIDDGGTPADWVWQSSTNSTSN